MEKKLSVHNTYFATIISAVFQVLLIVIFMVLRKRLTFKLVSLYVWFYFLLEIISIALDHTMLMQITTSDYKNKVFELEGLRIMFSFITLTSLVKINVKSTFFMTFIMIILEIILHSTEKAWKEVLLYSLFGLVCHQGILTLIFKFEVQSFNNNKTINKQSLEEKNLLNNLLPLHVLDKFLSNLKSSRSEFTEVVTDVTILFADIANFTKYSSSVEPEQVVHMVKNLFTEFDKSCVE